MCDSAAIAASQGFTPFKYMRRDVFVNEGICRLIHDMRYARFFISALENLNPDAANNWRSKLLCHPIQTRIELQTQYGMSTVY